MWESRSVNFGLGQVWIILFFYWSLLLDLIGLNVVQSNTRFENVLVMLKTCTLNNCGMYHMRSRKKWHNALQDECFMKIRKWWRTTIASLDLVLYGPYSKAVKTELGTTWTVWWYWKKLPWKWTVQIEQKSLTAAFEWNWTVLFGHLKGVRIQNLFAVNPDLLICIQCCCIKILF